MPSSHQPNDAQPAFADLAPISGYHVQTKGLTGIERMLLVSDGTFTPQLEALLGRPLVIKVLRNGEVPVDARIAERFAPTPVTTIWRRQVAQADALSGRTYMHADSYVNIDAFGNDLRRHLIESALGIGRIARMLPRPPEREPVGFYIEQNEAEALELGLERTEQFLCKVYRMKVAGAYAAVITERMPRSLLAIRQSG
ncbi:hypothetical protein GJW-30_1_02471 [Variibacter gotjawalensis]|uniref:UTRA domain-containing protein n=2 Tax=Variibacter gotjawalensis TaxID=1333996 RepID=A0A0S3PVW8_9BRAD|nr:chorismate lyase [Variibacter gotjawalensis]BAT59936.1 hypothetical protein GJW-30_1_02471 [Variibacter gotjawalensis]